MGKYIPWKWKQTKNTQKQKRRYSYTYIEKIDFKIKSEIDKERYCCFCNLVTKSCLTLYHPMYCSLPGSSVYAITQAKILGWVASFCSRGSSWPKDQTCISFFGRWFFTIEPPGMPKVGVTLCWRGQWNKSIWHL